jgi:hypothetical protein
MDTCLYVDPGARNFSASGGCPTLAVFLEQPAGALPIHIEEGKNHTVQEWHVQIKVLTCQSHQEIFTIKWEFVMVRRPQIFWHQTFDASRPSDLHLKAYIFHNQKKQDLKAQSVNIKSGMRCPSYRNTLMPK